MSEESYLILLEKTLAREGYGPAKRMNHLAMEAKSISLRLFYEGERLLEMIFMEDEE